MGHLGGWLLVTFEALCRVDATCWAQFTCSTAMRCNGCIQAPERERKKLTSEAKVFVPKVLREYFDADDGWFKMEFDSQQDSCINPPGHYLSIIHGARASHRPPSALSFMYTKAMNDTVSVEEGKELLKYVYSELQMNSRHLISLDSPNYCESFRLDLLHSMHALQWCEEMQMDVDIKKYDLHREKVMFVLHEVGPDDKLLTAKVRVNGSNENRPCIMIGDSVTLRSCSGKKIEIVGVVTKFVLVSEEVTIRFPLKDFFFSEIGHGMHIWPHREKESAFISVMNSTRYNIRFSYDRSGLSFSHSVSSVPMSTFGCSRNSFYLTTPLTCLHFRL